jgi:hypothetical protein
MNSGSSASNGDSSLERKEKAIEEGPSESTGFPSAKPLPTQSPENAIGISYSPLNKDQDEIRLIKILPYTTQSSHVCCTLETVSLTSLTPENRHFTSVSSSTGRKRVIGWTNTVGNNVNSPIRTSAVVLLQHFATSPFLAS